MEANNKREFFQLLTSELNRVGIDDTAEIAADFEEHFANSAANGLSEAEACHRLGDIKEIARNYLNLESSRINSMVARDVERKRVSLTKPGRSVPADLSLVNARDAANSDNVRSYTPQHISSEVYPNQNVSNPSNINMNGGYNSNPQNVNFIGQSANTNNTSGTSTNPNAGVAAQNEANQSVADAFSDAGKAIADAAKVTGQAIAGAFSNSGVKDAVIGAGKSAANAVKTAGRNAADAVSKARNEHEQRQNQHQNRQGYGVPRPNDEFRENNNQNHTGSIPRQTGKAKNTKGAFKFVDVSTLKPNVNTGKLITAILLDIFLWDWLIPAMAGIVLSFFAAAAKCVFWESFKGLFSGFNTVFPTNFFLFTGFVALGLALVCIAVWIARLLAQLVVFIVNMHIRAIYDL